MGTKADVTVSLMGPAESSKKVVSNELLSNERSYVHTEAVPQGNQQGDQGMLEGFPRELGRQHDVDYKKLVSNELFNASFSTRYIRRWLILQDIDIPASHLDAICEGELERHRS